MAIGNGFEKTLSNKITAFAEVEFASATRKERLLEFLDQPIAPFCLLVFFEKYCGDDKQR